MEQITITYLIIAVAVGYLLWQLFGSLLGRQSNTSSCGGCAKCSVPSEKVLPSRDLTSEGKPDQRLSLPLLRN